MENIQNIPFWESKCHLILTQYKEKEHKLYFTEKGRYKNLVRIYGKNPVGKEEIIRFLIQEKFLQKHINEEGLAEIHITEEGCQALSHHIMDKEINQDVAFSTSLVAIFIAAFSHLFPK